MYRAEIIANRSIQDETIAALEATLPKIRYTVLPDIQGRGKDDRKLGTVTWPELNFVLFSYVDDGEISAVRAVVDDIKRRFPNEGMKAFFVPGCE
jgi:hypothetical protein